VSAATDFRACAVVPTLDNPRTVRATVEGIAARGLPVVLVDDGSAREGQVECAALAAERRVTLLRRALNGGKGAAVLDGFARASDLGFTHAFQVDADGQHDLGAIPRFLEAARAHPAALVLGYPEYVNAPRVRRFARGLTRFFVGLEVGAFDTVEDALIGFRIYPLRAALASGCRARGMEFDFEIAVRMIWAGTPVVNLPVAIRYLALHAGGVSHFRLVRDNARFSLTHARLCTRRALWGLCAGPDAPAAGGRIE
jgi:glycosyltransferase involved in cell wall biosynthesis